jgi:hypothetical protein
MSLTLQITIKTTDPGSGFYCSSPGCNRNATFEKCERRDGEPGYLWFCDKHANDEFKDLVENEDYRVTYCNSTFHMEPRR